MARRSSIFLGIIGLQLVALVGFASHAALGRANAMTRQAEERRLVRALGLTDLCICTEARYTRHPSMADPHAAFQDGPMTFDHFPSGTIILPQR